MRIRSAVRAGLLVALLAARLLGPWAASHADPAPTRAWEVNGIRLEPAQVERLSADIARQTVAAVRRIEGIALREEQARELERIYRDVALDVYDAAVDVVRRDDLPDPEKEKRVMDLVLSGQERSTRLVARVLDPEQYARYRAWEERQVEAFRKRGLWSSRRRGRGGRR